MCSGERNETARQCGKYSAMQSEDQEVRRLLYQREHGVCAHTTTEQDLYGQWFFFPYIYIYIFN